MLSIISFQRIWSYPKLSKKCLKLEALDRMGDFICLESDSKLGVELFKDFYSFTHFYLPATAGSQSSRTFTLEDIRRNFNTLASILSKHKVSYQLSSKYFTAVRFRDLNFLPFIPEDSILNLQEVRLVGRYTPLYLTSQSNHGVNYEELSLYGAVPLKTPYSETFAELERSLPLSLEANGLEGIFFDGKSLDIEGKAASMQLIKQDSDRLNDRDTKQIISEFHRRMEQIKLGDKNLLKGIGLNEQEQNASWNDFNCVQKGMVFASVLDSFKISYRLLGIHPQKYRPERFGHLLIEYYDDQSKSWLLADPTHGVYTIAQHAEKNFDFSVVRKYLRNRHNFSFLDDKLELKESLDADSNVGMRMFFLYVIRSSYIWYHNKDLL